MMAFGSQTGDGGGGVGSGGGGAGSQEGSGMMAYGSHSGARMRAGPLVVTPRGDRRFAGKSDASPSVMYTGCAPCITWGDVAASHSSAPVTPTDCANVR